MVVGIDRFREYFKDYQGSYILIGGVAASITMELLDEPFRATKDLDVVLVVEALNREYVGQFWKFIKDGGYAIRQNGDSMGAPLFSIASRILRTNPSLFRSSFFLVCQMAWSTKNRHE